MMIHGRVNRRLEFTLPLEVIDAGGEPQTIDAVIDTGFTGALTLPPDAIAHLGLPWRSRSSAVLASGQISEFDSYVASVIWGDAPRRILVHAIENVPLLGTRLLDGFELRAAVFDGGAIEITPVVLR